MAKWSLMRGYILSIIFENEGINVTELSKKVGLSRGNTIYRYLRELEDRGLITMEKESKKKYRRNKPTIIKTTEKAKPFKSSSMKNAIDFFDKVNNTLKG